MSLRYTEFTGLSLPAIEKEMLLKWEEAQTFEKSISLRDGATPFVFYEGPPSANGMPGIHHVISRTLKDLVCRYKTMQGFQVKRKGGWDTHGLPVELGVEKELGITKEDIGKKISVEEYNQKCREAVLRYKDKWDDITRKMGYWVDLNNPYITFKNEYIETLWWLLSQLHKKGLLYESVSIQPYSPAAGTGLSSHELNQPGTYKDVKDTSAVAMFKASANPSFGGAYKNPGIQKMFSALAESENPSLESREIFFLAWTTTPWTLPSNLGLTVGPNIDYVLVKTMNPYIHLPVNIVMAKALLHKYFKAENENADVAEYKNDGKSLPYKIMAEFKGSAIEGCEYEQLLPFEANTLAQIKETTPEANPFRIVAGDFVTTEDGTGIVHTAPAFGADDYKIGQKNNLGILTLVDKQGRFLADVKDGIFLYGNEYVKEAYFNDEEKEAAFLLQKEILEAEGKVKELKKYLSVDDRIVLKLQEEGKLFKKEKYEHNYPHCWRTDKPILYYPLDAWFIKTTAIRDRMVELNKTINWKPKSTGEGRFGNWLENMVDWNLSRSRFWGTPLPIWKTDDGEEEICIGSIQQLKEELKKSFDSGVSKVPPSEELDLHKPYVDEIILVSNSGKPMKRVPDLIDVWFDSGAMPYAQWGLDQQKLKDGDIAPFGPGWEGAFPADFIAEGVDQTRGWFYTLHVIGALVFDSVAYKTVVSNGLVLDKNGNKMSKRLGNVVDPFDTIATYGADATRWYLITNASPWDNLKFDIDGIKEVQRKFFGTLYNTYQFFALYANVDGFNFSEVYIPVEQRPEIDRWILSSLHSLIKKVNEYMDDYEPTQAGRAIEDFVDQQLSNWYVRLCRRRFWKGEYEKDKICAYQTLYECLETTVRLMAPISPFFSDLIFQNLNAVTNRFSEQSVHHAIFPQPTNAVIDELLEERMQLAQHASSLILSLRKKAILPNGQTGIKVRQPLQKVLIPAMDSQMKGQLQKIEELIKAEVNIKTIEYLQPDNAFIHKKIKPNFSALGKKLGQKMKAASAALAQLSQEQIALLEKEGQYNLSIDDEAVILQLTELEVVTEDIPGWMVATKGRLTVALDITLTPELESEGNAREFINRIQKIRKDSGFELTDRIIVKVALPLTGSPDQHSIKESLTYYKDYICAEILADELEIRPELQEGTVVEVNDIFLNVIVSKKEE